MCFFFIFPKLSAKILKKPSQHLTFCCLYTQLIYFLPKQCVFKALPLLPDLTGEL